MIVCGRVWYCVSEYLNANMFAPLTLEDWLSNGFRKSYIVLLFSINSGVEYKTVLTDVHLNINVLLKIPYIIFLVSGTLKIIRNIYSLFFLHILVIWLRPYWGITVKSSSQTIRPQDLFQDLILDLISCANANYENVNTPAPVAKLWRWWSKHLWRWWNRHKHTHIDRQTDREIDVAGFFKFPLTKSTCKALVGSPTI